MKYSKYFLLLLILFCTIVLFTTCKKDVLVEINDLPKLSFPEIKLLPNIDSTRTEVTINFQISGELPNDSLRDFKVVYWTKNGSTAILTEEFNRGENIITLTNLLPKTKYCYKIQVSRTETNQGPFESEEGTFETTSVTLRFENISENEEDLSITAISSIQEFGEVSLSDIDRIGHIWSYGDIIRTTYFDKTKFGDNDGKLAGGVFTTQIKFADFTKDTCRIKVFIDFFDDDEELDSTYEIKSDGDFWVDLVDLPALISDPANMDQYLTGDSSTYYNSFSGIDGLEGAISFTIGNEAYIGMGRSLPDNMNGDSKQFYKYNAKLNTWESLPLNFFPYDGRMFATSYQTQAPSDEIYIGAGCTKCETIVTCLDPDPSNRPIFQPNYYKYTTNGIWSDISNTLDPSIEKNRFGAYSFFNNSLEIFGGIGLGLKIKDEFVVNVINNGDYIPSNNNTGPRLGNVCDRGNDGYDFGEWVDNDGYKHFNSGEWNPNNTDLNFDPGEWLDGDKNGNGVLDFGEILDGKFDSGEWNWKMDLDKIFEPGLWKDRNRNGELDQNDLIGKTTGQGTMQIDTIVTITQGKIVSLKGIAQSILLKDLVQMYDFGEWNDESYDNSGMWISANPDGVFYSGEWNRSSSGTTAAFNTFDTGEWLDGDTNGNHQLDSGESPDGIFTPGEWAWKPGDDYSFQSGDWNPITNNLAPFEVVYGNFCDANNNGMRDPGEIDDGLDALGRIGANIWNIGGVIYRVSGNQNITSTSNMIEPIARRNGTWNPISLEIFGGSFINRNFPFSFVIDGKGYVGGGETSDEEAISFDIWEFVPSNNNEGTLTKVQGCGLSSLTRGIGFAIDGKGYAGFGKVNIEPTIEFWMYVPKLK